MTVTKAIVPAAGLGTRFLPVTKSVPKEMLPLLDKPAAQYIVEEAAKSSIKDLIMVVSKNKKILEDHFDLAADHLREVTTRANTIDHLEKLISMLRFIFIRQHEPLGLGHAVLSARSVFKDEYVGIMLPDDIYVSHTPAMAQLQKVAVQERCSVIAVQEVPMSLVSQKGIISIKKQITPNLFQVKELVEKPTAAKAPSNLAIVGRYILAPGIFDALTEVNMGAVNELQLTDGIQQLIYSGEKVFAYKVQGTHFDTGTPLGWLKANLAMAFKNPNYADPLREYFYELEKEYSFLHTVQEQVLNK